MEEDMKAALERQIEEAREEAAYYKGLSKRSGDARLREAEELSRLIAALKTAEKELERGRDELEKRVEDRTAELLRANLVLSQEISERKRAEEALGQSELRFRSLAETTSDWIWEVDQSGVYTYTNQNVLDLLGYEPAEILGKTAFDFMPRDEAERIGTVFAEIVQSQRPFSRLENVCHHKDGRRIILETSGVPIFDEGGNLSGYRGIDRDITERKSAEEALRESEERYRRLFELESDAILLIDNETGRILEANSSASETYGYSRHELLTKRNTDLSAEPEETRRVTEATPILSDRVVKVALRIHRRKDGTVFPVEITGRFFTFQGRSVHIATVRDITDRKRAEEEKAKLERQNRQLRKAESLGRMAGAIAHRFNNQLQAVIGNLEMAIGDLPQGAGSVNNLTAALQAAGKAAEISGLMLTYLGQTPGKHAPLDLSEACRRNLPMLHAVMPENVGMETDLPTPGPTVRANANQIQQVLTNLVTNAWEVFGEGRGVIRLSVKTVSPAEIPASNRFPIDWQPQDNAYACMEVVDTGSGIGDNDIDNLFDPFFSSKSTGRGLGLSVVLGIARACGGAITVESEPGRGSAFRVFFPLSVEEVPRQPDKEAQAPEREWGGTVLLVEDEEMVRNMTKRMLTSLGFTVLSAKDGVEALEAFRQRRDEIRLVLCDLTMPRMNGWETLTALRKLAPDVPVILASGYTEALVMEGDHPEWPQVFLGKPYRIKELSHAISQALLGKKK